MKIQIKYLITIIVTIILNFFNKKNTQQLYCKDIIYAYNKDNSLYFADQNQGNTIPLNTFNLINKKFYNISNKIKNKKHCYPPTAIRVSHDCFDVISKFHKDRKTLLFIQTGIKHIENSNIMNFGIGQRIIYNNTWIVGYNTFYDTYFSGKNQSRLGVGAELFYNYMHIRINKYHGIKKGYLLYNEKRNKEHALDGYDVNIHGWLPFFPAISGKIQFTHHFYDKILVDLKIIEKHKSLFKWIFGMEYSPISILTFGIDEIFSNNNCRDKKITISANYQFGLPFKQQFKKLKTTEEKINENLYSFIVRDNNIALTNFYKINNQLQLLSDNAIVHNDLTTYNPLDFSDKDEYKMQKTSDDSTSSHNSDNNSLKNQINNTINSNSIIPNIAVNKEKDDTSSINTKDVNIPPPPPFPTTVSQQVKPLNNDNKPSAHYISLHKTNITKEEKNEQEIEKNLSYHLQIIKSIAEHKKNKFLNLGSTEHLLKLQNLNKKYKKNQFFSKEGSVVSKILTRKILLGYNSDSDNYEEEDTENDSFED